MRILNPLLLLALAAAGVPASAAEPTLTPVMQSNFGALMALQPLVASPGAFADPANRSDILKELETLAGLKHVAPGDLKGHEPARVAIAALYSAYVGQLQAEFKAGETGEHVRRKVQALTGLCLGCHSQLTTSRSFNDSWKRVEMLSLPPLEKARLYAATRQFDKALEAYKGVLAGSAEIAFAQALREALSITVRVQRDSAATFALLDELSRRTDLPEDLRHHVRQWRYAALRWKREKSQPEKAGELIGKARTLVERGQKAQIYTPDPTGDLDSLRATGYLAEALAKNPRDEDRGEAFYLMGVAYTGLRDPLLAGLDTLYLEACVREAPHTDYAKRCFRRYAAIVDFGYIEGRAAIASDEVYRLHELAVLAK